MRRRACARRADRGLDPAGRDEILSLVSGTTTSPARPSSSFPTRWRNRQVADRLLVMNHAKSCSATPRARYSPTRRRSSRPASTSPMITKVMLELKKRGHAVDTSVFTVAQALEALRACKRKEGAH